MDMIHPWLWLTIDHLSMFMYHYQPRWKYRMTDRSYVHQDEIGKSPMTDSCRSNLIEGREDIVIQEIVKLASSRV